MRNIFGFKKPVVITEAEKATDIALLLDMAYDIRYLRASNGKHYFYYFVNKVENLGTIRKLFERYGLKPAYHLSQYYSPDSPAYRIKYRKLTLNTQNKKFADGLVKAFGEKYRPKSMLNSFEKQR